MRNKQRVPDETQVRLLEEIHPKLRALSPGRQALVAAYARWLRMWLWFSRAWRHFRRIIRRKPGCNEVKMKTDKKLPSSKAASGKLHMWVKSASDKPRKCKSLHRASKGSFKAEPKCKNAMDRKG